MYRHAIAVVITVLSVAFFVDSPVLASNVTIESVSTDAGRVRRGDVFITEVKTDRITPDVTSNLVIDGEEYFGNEGGGACRSDGELFIGWDNEDDPNPIVEIACTIPRDISDDAEISLIAYQFRNCEEGEDRCSVVEGSADFRLVDRSSNPEDNDSSEDIAQRILEALMDLFRSRGGNNDDNTSRDNSDDDSDSSGSRTDRDSPIAQCNEIDLQDMTERQFESIHDRVTSESIPFQSYGLPSPDESTAESIKEDIEESENLRWAADQFLAYEKILDEDYHLRVIPYMTTAWVWIEGGLSPYGINCNDNRAGYKSEVSFFCNQNNFQIAGYQAATRKNDYVAIYHKCHGRDANVNDTLQCVVNNSSRAQKDQWSYMSSNQQNQGIMKSYFDSIERATISNISPNSDFFDEKTQLLTLMLGKDPCMVIGLNSFAVSQGDLVRALQNPCAYGYFCAPLKKRMSNMMRALQLYDKDNPPNLNRASNDSRDDDRSGDRDEDDSDDSRRGDPRDGFPPQGRPIGNDKGERVGRFVHTYYYFAQETDYEGPDTDIYYRACSSRLSSVVTSFAKDVCVQGSGVMTDERLIHFAGTCTCGPSCLTGSPVCYNIIDRDDYPWGLGANGEGTIPFRTIAVDRNVIELGTRVYMPEWDGVRIPESDDGKLGGFTHDGCFIAGDVGGWINGYHYDFFAGTRELWQELEDIRPTRTYSTVYINADRCRYED